LRDSRKPSPHPAILVLLLAASAASLLADAGGVPRAPAVKAGPAPDLAVFFAGEVLGWTEPCG
jgi:hypothetical protein